MCIKKGCIFKLLLNDFVGLPDAFTGEDKLHEVIAVSTDDESGDHIKMIEKYIGCPLHKITTKYLKREVEWNVADNDR